MYKDEQLGKRIVTAFGEFPITANVWVSVATARIHWLLASSKAAVAAAAFIYKLTLKTRKKTTKNMPQHLVESNRKKTNSKSSISKFYKI